MNNIKRILKPVICIATGVLNLIFMALNYASAFAKSNLWDVSENEKEAFSSYGLFSFGENSLGSALEDVLSSNFGVSSKATGLLTLAGILMILSLIVSIALILLGLVGLAKEFLKINVLGKATPKLYTYLYLGGLGGNIILNLFPAIFVLLCCAANSHREKLLGMSMSAGLQPGLGMLFLILIALGAPFCFWFFTKKSAAAKIWMCGTCHAVIQPTDRFCKGCGNAITAPVLASAPTPAQGSFIQKFFDSLTDEDPEGVEPISRENTSAAVASVKAKILTLLEKYHIAPKMALAVLGGVVGVIVIVIVLVSIPWPQKPAYIVPENSIFTVYNAEDDETVIIVNGQEQKKTIDGSIHSSSQSMNGDVLAFIDGNDTLYLFYKNELIEVEDNVQDYRLAIDGSSVAFISEDDELILYSASDKKDHEITDELYMESYRLSPDGDSVLYTEGSGDNLTMYLWYNGSADKVDRDLVPLALSNKGGLLYYYNTQKDSVYVSSEKHGEVKLANSTGMKFMFNADHTQALMNYDGYAYITVNGQEKSKIASDGIAQFGDTDMWGVTINDSDDSFLYATYTYTMPLENLANQYFLDDSGNLMYLNKKLSASEVAENISQFRTTVSGDVVYFKNTLGRLYRGEKPNGKFERITEDVSAFAITSDGDGCYVVDYDSMLLYVSASGKSKKIADDLSNGILAVTHDDYALFVTDYSSTSGGTLYASQMGKKKTRISDDVKSIVTAPNGSYFLQMTDDDCGKLFWAEKKTAFEQIAKDVSF